ncbi:Growth-regulating factor 3 [Citrus sinensis]|nr:Growth-regulating factor 3 [Citrus sinensis]
MGSYFSLAQWQELELQALIYRYMLAGAVVPPELLQPIKKSLVNSSPYFLHHPLQHYSHFQPASLQSGYWGRGAMDPEPGRCRRTDGKKWRCSRDVVAGHKYCERHMHRGRNRSRKHVEIPTPTSSAAARTTLKTTSSTVNNNNNNNISAATVAAPSPFAQMANATTFALSAHSPSIDLLQFNQSSCVSKAVKGLFEPQNEVGNRSDGHILRPFFDDWPRSLHDHNNCESNSSTVNSATCLSISMPGNLSSSDVSLKLSTGNIDEPGSQGGEREEPQLNWAAGWATHTVASMGGPLAEALRSSTSNSNSSPTSVLHQLPRSSASEASYVST